MGKRVSIRIGTSGRTYKHWQGIFYPDKWPKSRWLEYYIMHFDTVELNATFYRLPNRRSFENWKSRTPDKFVWSVKSSKFITHTEKLNPLQNLLMVFMVPSPALEKNWGSYASKCRRAYPLMRRYSGIFVCHWSRKLATRLKFVIHPGSMIRCLAS